MRKTVAALLCSVVMGLLPGDRSPAAEIAIKDWSYKAPIEGNDHGRSGIYRLALSPEVFDAALPDLRDLRVAAREGEEIGYVLRIDGESLQKDPVEVRIYNRTNIPGKESSVTVDFGRKAMKNRVKVETRGANFKRGVRIEGSDDGRNWRIVRDGAFLFRIPDGRGKGVRFELDETEIPDNDLRYLKITVFNDAGDEGVVEVKDVKAWRIVRTVPETVDVPIRKVKKTEKKRSTEIEFDLGLRNLPLYELELAFSDDDYFRRVRVLGRNRKTRVLKIKAEDSPHLERTVKEPWKIIGSGTVFRFSSDRSGGESPALSLSGAKYRYLLVRILNGDDPPLHFSTATVTRRVVYVEFARRASGDYAVYVGNPKAKRPSYDIGHYIDGLRGRGVYLVALGELVPNPRHRAAERPLPWSERHSGVILLALAVMVAVLGLLIYRFASSAGTSET